MLLGESFAFALWGLRMASSLIGPHPLSENVRDRMRRQRSQDTGPEIRLRRILHRRGLRYRIHRRPIPGLRRTSDIVFTNLKIAIDIRGCFWHGCHLHRTIPVNNHEWWSEKIEKNRSRDAETERVFENHGWQLVIVWEHDDMETAASVIEDIVHSARAKM
jgi:DNA mismatch endonuclease, patch repair protein